MKYADDTVLSYGSSHIEEINLKIKKSTKI